MPIVVDLSELTPELKSSGVRFEKSGNSVTVYFANDPEQQPTEQQPTQQIASCTRAQFIDALLVADMYDQVENFVVSRVGEAVTQEETLAARRMKNWWENSLHFESSSPMLLTAANSLLGWTQEQVRDFILSALERTPE